MIDVLIAVVIMILGGGFFLSLASIENSFWKKRALLAEAKRDEVTVCREADYWRIVEAVAEFDGRRAIDTEVRDLAREMLRERS